MSYLEPQNMKHAQPLFSIALASLAIVIGGCGSLTQRVSSLEDDELYLERNEEYLTDAEYLAYAYEQAGYGQPGEDVRDGDEFNSPFGYVPQSLRGRSMLRGYMTPYGAAGFGMNPYDPYASSFYGGYNPYDPYGGFMGYGGSWGNSWGMNPYAMNSFGYNPYGGYGYNPYGYNPYSYGYNPYGYGGWGATTWGSAGSGDVYESGYIVMGSRTPIWSSSSINSSGTGGRLLSNRELEVEEPEEVWTIWNAAPARTSSSMPAYRPSSSSQGERSNNSYREATESRPSQSSWSNSSRSNSSRSSSWSGSSSGSSTRGSSGTTRGSSNSSSGSSRGNSSGRSTGRSGGRQ